MSIEEWDEVAAQPINLEEMDKLITRAREKREEYEDQKKKASELYKEYAELEGQVISALEAAGKKSYKVDGLGTFSLVEKSVVTTPKTIEEKQQLYDWIISRYGEEFCISLTSINHQSLNSFYNQEFKKAEDPSMFHIPGLQEPTTKKEARFRKA